MKRENKKASLFLNLTADIFYTFGTLIKLNQ